MASPSTVLASSTQQGNEHFRFFDLVRELRNMIYGHMETVSVTQKDHDTRHVFHLPLATGVPRKALQRVCRQFSEEYLDETSKTMTLHFSVGISTPNGPQPQGTSLRQIIPFTHSTSLPAPILIPWSVLGLVRNVSLKVWIRRIKDGVPRIMHWSYPGSERESAYTLLVVMHYIWRCLEIMRPMLPRLSSLTLRAQYECSRTLWSDTERPDPVFRRLLAMRKPFAHLGSFTVDLTVEGHSQGVLQEGGYAMEVVNKSYGRWRLSPTEQEGAFLGFEWDAVGEEEWH